MKNPIVALFVLIIAGVSIFWIVNVIDKENTPVTEMKIQPSVEQMDRPSSEIIKKTLTATDIYNKTAYSTVTIAAIDANGNILGQGSGFYVTDNVIATNYHVMDGATYADIYLPDRSSPSTRIDSYLEVSKWTDLILLYAPDLDRPALDISYDDLPVGDQIYVIGSPRGMQATISEGIISAIRELDDRPFIQITAPISGGSSGGPVLNKFGEVIGISTLTREDAQNINFAAATSSLRQLLLAYNYNKLSYLLPVSSEVAANNGKQSYNFNITAYSMANLNEVDNTWSEWTDWKESNFLLVLDLAEGKVNIHSESLETYDIIGTETPEEDNEKREMIRLICTDKNGYRCKFVMMGNKSDERLQAMFIWDESIVAYYLKDQ